MIEKISRLSFFLGDDDDKTISFLTLIRTHDHHPQHHHQIIHFCIENRK